MTLFSALSEYNPKELGSGQIRCKCLMRENHTGSADGSMSMILSPEYGSYRCWSCGVRGSILSLLTTRLEIPYFEAATMVAEQLLVMPAKKSRKFEIETPWTLGQIPEFYREKHFSPALLKTFRVGETKDGWMAIPFYMNGSLQGVQYRKDKHKDRFIQNTPGFDLKNFIYNYNPTEKEATLVEGYGDVWRLTSFGDHAEGLMGIAFGEERANLMSVHDLIYVATDNDEAGRKAVEVINYLMRPYRTQIWIVPYLGKDPGAIKSEKEWKEYKEASTPYVEYAVAMAEYDEDYLEKRAKWLRNISKVYSSGGK